MPDDYADLESRITTWAASRSDIYALIVAGSRARLDPPPDRWADLDLIFFVARPDPYTADSRWIEQFGAILIPQFDPPDEFSPDSEWLILFESGYKVDFLFITADPHTGGQGVAALMGASMHTGAFSRGVRVLIDRAHPENVGRIVAKPLKHSPRLPTEAEYLDTLHRLWLDAFRAARLIRRDDLWRAMRVINTAMKDHLLTLIEWHARATYGVGRDVWYGGRHLQEWADPRAADALPGTIAAYDPSSMRHALDANLDLARWLAAEIAPHLGCTYPADREAQLLDWLRQLREDS